MEDIIYEHDYSVEVKAVLEQTYTESHEEAWRYTVNEGVMQAIGQRFRELPHIIIPQNKIIFEECEKLLDYLAFCKGGRIRSVISYETFDAYIYLDLPFFEFNGESLETLKYIVNNAHSVNFVPSDDEKRMRLSVRVNYFEDIGDKDAIIHEEIMKHPELVDLMAKSHEEELLAVLDDPRFRANIEAAAAEIGMTAEEWLIYMDRAAEEHPEILQEFLYEGLTKRRQKVKGETEE